MSLFAMSLKTIVKVGKITNLSDARYCAGMNVAMLGFVTVENQENYLPIKDYQDIRGWVSGPEVVAEVYGIENSHQLASVLEAYRPDYLELGERELSFVNTDLPLLVRVQSANDLSSLQNKNVYAVITSEALALQLAPLLTEKIRILIDADTSVSINTLLENNSISGIVLSGTKEESPGLKDYDHLAEILESLEVD